MAIKQIARAKWRVVIFVGRINGKQRQRVYTVHGTRKDAEKLERAKLGDRDGDRLPADGSATFGQLAKQLMALRGDLFSPTTAARYQSLLDHHILPHLRDLRLEKIAPRNIEALYVTLAKSGHRRRKGGLSQQTILHCHTLLQSLFKFAKREKLVTYNIMADVDRPEVPKQKRKTVAPDQLSGLVAALQQSKYRVPIVLAVSTGLRRGEVLGLRWRDIDLDAATMTVSQTLVEDEAKQLHVKPPKSENSKRTIALAQATVTLLRDHRKEQRELMLMLGKDYRRDLDLVCAGPDGDYIRPSRLTTGFRSIAVNHGLPGIGLHDLRHTHATWLLESGVDLKTISSRLGHSTIALTANTYTNVTAKLDQDAAKRLNKYLEG